MKYYYGTLGLITDDSLVINNSSSSAITMMSSDKRGQRIFLASNVLKVHQQSRTYIN